MRKVKLNVVTKVPGWHFCNNDEIVTSVTPSQEKCKFCKKVKGGYMCILYDEYLTSSPTLVDKSPRCIEAATQGSAEVTDSSLSVDPKLIIKESIDGYIKHVNDLMKQGYPQVLAETVARKYMLGEK